MLILVVILLILVLGSAFRLWAYQRNVKKMTQQLESIIQHFGTNELLKVTIPDKELDRFTVSVNRLITLYKQDQQQKQKKNMELKQEITNISHDLRTPLTSIKGFSDLLKDDSLSLAERQEYLAIIEQKADALIMIADLFYEISQIDSADYLLTPEKLTLESLVAESIMPFYQDFEEKQLSVTIKENHLNQPIWVDQRATKRILFNIIQNGLRYASSFFTLEVLQEEDYLVLQATNDTQEASAAQLERIFERTYTIDTSREKGQTGLGLYIVKELSEMQGGKVAASIEDGVFTVRIYFRA